MYTLYYRNYMKSCNYRCFYCPFSKSKPSEAAKKKDQIYFERFLEYLENSSKQYKIFFAPRGELLGYEYYQLGLDKLSHLKNIKEVVIQTNLSHDVSWLKNVNKDTLTLWSTFHPNQVKCEDFFYQVQKVIHYGIKMSVGVVGVLKNFEKIKRMKCLLDTLEKNRPYLWINAYKDQKDYYKKEEISFLESIDPLFHWNLKNYASLNQGCDTGENVFFIEYQGRMHRCFQDHKKLGNLYTTDLEDIKIDSLCKKNECNCYIGYIHLKNLNLKKVYLKSLLGRIPR